jgi:hypothetical protein
VFNPATLGATRFKPRAAAMALAVPIGVFTVGTTVNIVHERPAERLGRNSFPNVVYDASVFWLISSS